jgi:pimeloyl-ACP methyl ester carboxylesterase
MWKDVAAILADDFHVLVPDLPEQGGSSEVYPFSHSFAADCLCELIDAFAHHGKAHVVGLSEGAQVTVELLAKHPQVVDHAVVSSAILHPMPGGWMYTRPMFRWMYRWFMAPLKNNDSWIRLNMRYSAGIGDEYFDDFKRSFQELSESGFVNLMYKAMHYRMPPGLEKVTAPVLVATGALEYAQMHQSARDLLAVLPRSRGVTVSFGKGSTLAKEHNWALTDPQLFAATVKAWVTDSPLPADLMPVS